MMRTTTPPDRDRADRDRADRDRADALLMTTKFPIAFSGKPREHEQGEQQTTTAGREVG